MRYFVTGASGFVGSAVTQELLGAGHQVLGMARSDDGAAKVAAMGAEVFRGSLEDPEGMAQAAASTDGVAHLAFNHDFSKFLDNCVTDGRVVTAMGAALAGTGKPLVVTSGIGLFSGLKLISEETVIADAPHRHPRAVSEEAVADFATQGVRSMVMRLAPSTHDKGDHGFVPMIIGMAREKGISAYLGAGDNLWPGVHRLDAARLYRLALEKGTAGARYHATDERGVPFREIATLIGNRLGLPVKSLSGDAAAAHFTWFAPFAQMDIPTTSQWTRETLGWQPREIGLLEDLNKHYFG
ncbi:SDR family oxidoreductase [Acidisoma cellulosilytica]|uniref:SDR family oxidoreductase n=1 Tax=Acidisoma cellulosilyticum TaxID=2802395 RepID=A0A963Z4S3_9PROT|nr:SDR family oxidoreductase [Acidisoma cellulosilyticum]MCB8882748.1 SDR family oxidoreductase [Acidisoma cellulosilyticum]